MLVVYGAVVIVAGTFATAAGPHAGGAGTGDVVERLDAFGAETLRQLILLHGHMATAMGILALLLWGVARPPQGAGRRSMRALTAVCLLLAVQGIVGLIQYHNALPAEVVWVHASLPAVLWTVLVWSWVAAGSLAPAPAERQRAGDGLMLVRFLRYGLPAVLVVAGFVILFTVEGNLRWDGWAMCVGSGLAILLLNVLFRFGSKGDRSASRRPRRATSTPSTATGRTSRGADAGQSRLDRRSERYS